MLIHGKDECHRIFCDACNGSGFDWFDNQHCDMCFGSGEIEFCADGG